MANLASNFVAFILGLGFLIFVHEAGHFFVAKFFKVRVLVFSFGFGKRLFGFHRGDTDYRVSLIPLGGYVRMAGDTPEDNEPGNPDEFLSKPKWQRFLILFAGPFMNIVIAIVFMAGIVVYGIKQYEQAPIIESIEKSMPAEKAGLAAGDRIVKVNDHVVKDFSDLRLMISMNAGTPLRVTYERAGVQRTTMLTPEREDGDFGPIGKAGIRGGLTDPVIGEITPGTPAAAAGLQVGDRIIATNGKPVRGLEEYATASHAAATKPLVVDIERNGQPLRVTLAPTPDKDEMVLRGVGAKYTLLKLSLLPALKYSVQENWKMLKFAGSAIRRMFRAEGSVKELSGPVSIARISGEMMRRGAKEFIALLAMISLQLGVMNLLPIPVLDGGHIMILLIEGVARRELSLRVKERIQQVGFAALATLMIVVLYNDVVSNVLRLGKG